VYAVAQADEGASVSLRGKAKIERAAFFFELDAKNGL
jgi:hypothetical protein